MAVIQYGFGISGIKGRIGSTIYSGSGSNSHIRSRSYSRNRFRTGHSTSFNIISSLSSSWRNLTPSQQSAWQSYSNHFTSGNRFGQSTRLSGYNMYQRINYYRLVLSLSILEDPPATTVRPVIYNVEQDLTSIVFEPTINNDEYYLQVSAGRQSSAGVTYPSTSFRTTYITGDDFGGFNYQSTYNSLYSQDIASDNVSLARLRMIDPASGLTSNTFSIFYRE